MVEYVFMTLKKPIFFSGYVVRGQDRSFQDIGIRTANLDRVSADRAGEVLREELRRTRHDGFSGIPEHEECSGVYYGVGKVAKSKLHAAVINVRVGRPGTLVGRFDVHLIDFDALGHPPLYDQPIKCVILGRLRDQKVFDSNETLRRTMQTDIERGRSLVDRSTIEQMSRLDYFKD